MSTTVDPKTAAKATALRERFLTAGGGAGDLYLADVTAPPVTQITHGPEGDFGLLDPPEGYTRVGWATQIKNPIGTLGGKLDEPLRPAASGGLSLRYRRALVRSTVEDERGAVYVATFLPRVRPDVDDDLNVVLYSYQVEVPGGGRFGPGSTYDRLVMFGGPGWVEHMRDLGLHP